MISCECSNGDGVVSEVVMLASDMTHTDPPIHSHPSLNACHCMLAPSTAAHAHTHTHNTHTAAQDIKRMHEHTVKPHFTHPRQAESESGRLEQHGQLKLHLHANDNAHTHLQCVSSIVSVLTCTSCAARFAAAVLPYTSGTCATAVSLPRNRSMRTLCQQL